MANQSFYDKKDVPQFQEEVCKKTCIMKGKCIEEGQDAHWFLVCTHYHSWKLGYTSFVAEHAQWESEHPEEAEEKHRQLVERAKAWKESQKKTKKTTTKTPTKKTTKKSAKKKKKD